MKSSTISFSVILLLVSSASAVRVTDGSYTLSEVDHAAKDLGEPPSKNISKGPPEAESEAHAEETLKAVKEVEENERKKQEEAKEAARIAQEEEEKKSWRPDGT